MSRLSDVAAVILAAGYGTRMKSKVTKMLHPLAGRPLVEYSVRAARGAGAERIVMVIGPRQGDDIRAAIGDACEYAFQAEQLGTGHAAMQAESALKGFRGLVLVLFGDAAMIRAETLNELIAYHREKNAAATLLTAKLPDPTGYGRVIREAVTGSVLRIVETKKPGDATPDEMKVDEVFTSVACFDSDKLWSALGRLTNSNAQREYYFTDVFRIIAADGDRVEAWIARDWREAVCPNDRVELAEAEALMRARINRKLMLSGVTIVDPRSTYIDDTVVIGPDTVIMPNTFICGNTVIGEDCRIGPNSTIKDCRIGNGVEIIYSFLREGEICDGASFGPFAHMRPGTVLGPRAKIGNFNELKNSRIGAGTKIAHLSYIGDATVGTDTIIGCGVITVNYDGTKKWPTKIGSRTLVGCNTNLVAPVEVGDDAYIAAGSTITDQVPNDSLAIARERQVTKPGYMKKKREKSE
ncbi:MAG: bifunctional UDP-N-acetylglucosamine diphosphorylase/glucosamine-1-phosphate N-acetyltransferase GlmU [Chloroflexota bacterium]